MKYLIVILVVLVVWWLLRPRLRRPGAPGAPGKDRSGKAEVIVHCEHCGLHLPRTEALAWRGGYYCDETHRLAAEQSKEP